MYLEGNDLMDVPINDDEYYDNFDNMVDAKVFDLMESCKDYSKNPEIFLETLRRLKVYFGYAENQIKKDLYEEKN